MPKRDFPRVKKYYALPDPLVVFLDKKTNPGEASEFIAESLLAREEVRTFLGDTLVKGLEKDIADERAKRARRQEIAAQRAARVFAQSSEDPEQ